MPLTEKQMARPDFLALSRLANDALDYAARHVPGVKGYGLMGAGLEACEPFDVEAGRVVDDLTALLMRIADEEAKK